MWLKYSTDEHRLRTIDEHIFIMTTFLLTGTKFSGEIELRYGDDELLLSYELRAVLTAEQKYWLMNNLPRCVGDLHVLVGSVASFTITEVKAEPVTFEAFWERYDDKENSSKKRTRQKWDKMPVAERERAFRHIPKYIARLPYGTRKKFAETYLNAELWNN